MKSSEEYLSSIYNKQEIYKKEAKHKRNRRRIMMASVAGIMCFVLAFVIIVEPMLSGKDKYVLYAADLMDDFDSKKTVKKDGREADADFTKAYADFALELFGNTVDSSENVLVSPLSVYTALAMTANGAGGETRAQMEEVFGMDMERLNAYMLSYAKSLSGTDAGKFNIANSIWFRNDGSLKVNDEFLQTNADFYKADAFAAEFDEKTVADINSWVKVKTDGMIEGIIDRLDEDAMMCLINTVLFDAEWKIPYDLQDVRKRVFQNAGGKFKTVDFMYSTEGIYLESDDAVGVIKPYKNEQYSFVALLPNADVNINDFVKTLTGDKWHDLIESRQDVIVDTAIPKFEHDYSADMKDILIAMGMGDAFECGVADFTGIGYSEKGYLYIENVFHKTYVSVDELGTKAGAATAVIVYAEGGILEKPKEVILNRPFVYAIMDNNTNLPIFIGTVMDIESEAEEPVDNSVFYTSEEQCDGIFKYTINEKGEATITDVTDKTIEKIEIPQKLGKGTYGEGLLVTAIGDFAFQFCEELTEVIIPDTVTSIGVAAFGSCSSLEKIVIPKSVTRIEGFAFACCYSLTEITIPDGLTKIEYSTFRCCDNLRKVVIPESVTTIDKYAFADCYSIEDVKLPGSVTYIGWGAFEDCAGLVSIEIPASVTRLESDTFKNCFNLKEAIIPATMEYIGPTAFWEDNKLTIITPADSYAEGYAKRKSISVSNISLQ